MKTIRDANDWIRGLPRLVGVLAVTLTVPNLTAQSGPQSRLVGMPGVNREYPMMKSGRAAILCPGTLALFLGLVAQALSAQVVDIPDPGLREAIRAALDKPTGDITVADMEGLIELDAGRGARGWGAPTISSLEGLQAAKNLSLLDLSGDFQRGTDERHANLATSDFTFLSGLRKLKALFLQRNLLPTFALPEGLYDLAILDLEWTELANLTLPNDSTSLRELNLSANRLTTLTFPGGLSGLTTLDLAYNQLAALTLPHEITNLATLDLRGNQLTSLTLPEGLASLGYLTLYDNPISELAVPAWMDLDSLTIDGFPKKQITFHAGTVKLQDGGLQWTRGVLQFAPEADGPWTDLPAASPFSLSPVGDKGFFRIKVEQ